MDIATIIGVVSGIVLVVFGMYTSADGQMGLFGDTASLAIVVGGAIAAVLTSSPLAEVIALGKVIKNAFKHKVMNPNQLIEDLVRYAELARRDGILALEGVADEIEMPFMVKAVQLAVDGTEPELIDNILNTEIEYIKKRHESGKKICELFGKYAPAFGMIGTLIGLVAMLANLDDVATIGPKMAVAIITTLYGAMVANMLFLPFADKLETRSKEEMLILELVVRGVMSIQQGDNPRIVQQKLSIILPPGERTEIED
jgi:chemotaxis protein MotA